MSAFARTMRTRTENRSECASRPSRATDHLRKPLLSSSEASKWCPKASLGHLWALLSGSWGALGRSCSAHGRSWAALGALLGHSRGAPGTLLGALVRSWDALGPLLDPLGRSWLEFGASEGRFWSLWGRFWRLLAWNSSGRTRGTTTKQVRNVESAWQQQCNNIQSGECIMHSSNLVIYNI